MSSEMDGIFSALLRVTAGTVAAPTAFAEVKTLNGDVKVPWETEVTQLDSRKTRNGKKGVYGRIHQGDEMEFTIDESEDDVQNAAIKAAYAAKSKLILVVCKSVLVTPGSPPTEAPNPDEEYLIGEYRVSSITPSRDPGKANSLSIKLFQTTDCAEAILVEP